MRGLGRYGVLCASIGELLRAVIECNETFAGLGYLAQPDMPTITWDGDNLWRGIFFHTGAMIGDFLGVYT